MTFLLLIFVAGTLVLLLSPPPSASRRSETQCRWSANYGETVLFRIGSVLQACYSLALIIPTRTRPSTPRCRYCCCHRVYYLHHHCHHQWESRITLGCCRRCCRRRRRCRTGSELNTAGKEEMASSDVSEHLQREQQRNS